MNLFNQNRRPYLSIEIVLLFITIVLLTTVLSAGEQAVKHQWTLKFELRLASYEDVEGWEKSSLPSGQSIWISPETSFNNTDVFKAQPEETGNGFSVFFMLTEDASLKFARFTKYNAGKFVAVMIDNRVVSAPKIIGEITSGRALIEGNLTEKEASRIAEGITGH